MRAGWWKREVLLDGRERCLSRVRLLCSASGFASCLLPSSSSLSFGPSPPCACNKLTTPLGSNVLSYPTTLHTSNRSNFPHPPSPTYQHLPSTSKLLKHPPTSPHIAELGGTSADQLRCSSCFVRPKSIDLRRVRRKIWSRSRYFSGIETFIERMKGSGCRSLRVGEL